MSFLVFAFRCVLCEMLPENMGTCGELLELLKPMEKTNQPETKWKPEKILKPIHETQMKQKSIGMVQPWLARFSNGTTMV